MDQPRKPIAGRTAPGVVPAADRPLRWAGQLFRLAALAGLGLFGLYVVLRAGGATLRNFDQWQPLLSGPPLADAGEWIANLGIGLHFAAGVVLVLAWPILFSARIRARYRAVHRWTGRVYAGAGVFAGVGGMSFILTHGAYTPAASVAFGIWGALLASCAVMAYLRARAKRFDLLIHLFGHVADLGTGQALNAEALCQMLHLSGGDTIDESFLHPFNQRRLAALALVHKEGNIAALSHFGHHQINSSHTGVEPPGPVARTITLAIRGMSRFFSADFR